MGGRLRVILVSVVATALVGLAVVVVVRRVVLHDTAEPASVADALTRYREVAARGTTPIPTGVYLYATRGSESVSVLGGAAHAYPVRSTITVTGAPCGMSLRWDVLTTRSVTWRVCPDGDARAPQRLEGWSERHQFFGQDDATDWRCGDAAWLVAGAGPGSRRAYRCDSADTTQAGSLVVVGRPILDVGGTPVGTVHLRITQDGAGEARGRIVDERWLERGSGLPVRLRYRQRSVNDSPIGDVVFEEAYDLSLLSLEPRT